MPRQKAKAEIAVTVRLPADVHAKMTAAAEADDRSQNSYIVRAIKAQLEREEPPKKSVAR